ncbi:MAG: Uncharacterized protein FD133_1599 [Erysipelotrichaceae bacterium]|nr:MAG: hypothetical protein FD179_1566 [Erysipelotrichaceae bacterium]TXT16968.1 MAG: Uncharacterized protein FD133_1599 [Erysipelotrichaceae bacterium]
MYHVSDVLKHGFCPKLFWYIRQEGSRSPLKFIQMTQSLSDILLKKVGLTEVFESYRSIDPKDVFEGLKTKKAVLNGRFEHHNLRVKIPLVHLTQEGLDVYFTTLSVNARVEDQRYLSMHIYVLESLGFPIHKIRVMSFNPDYVRESELDIDACFVFRDQFIRQNGKTAGNITEVLLSRKTDFGSELNMMDEVMGNEALKMTIDQCPALNRCEYFEVCFQKQFDLSQNSVFFLTQSANKRAFINEGLLKLDQLPLDRLEGTALQFAQIMADRNGGQFADKLVLKHWLNGLNQPLIFMDFEWDTHGIPPYHGMKPMDVLCFQYSLHILRDQDLAHYEFLESGDCRERFIQSLIHNTPKEGSIIAYNAFGAEAIRLNELGEQFPQYKAELDQMIERMVDLAVLFTEGIVYLSAMKGSFTLKNIIQVINPELNYAQLSIGHGLEAVKHYRTLQNNDDEDDIKDALLKYCKMDTLAMVEILGYLKSIV